MRLSERLAMLPVRKARLKELSGLVDEVAKLEEENDVLGEAIRGAHAALTELEIKAGRTSRLVYLANKALQHALFTTPEDTPISDIPASP